MMILYCISGFGLSGNCYSMVCCVFPYLMLESLNDVIKEDGEIQAILDLLGVTEHEDGEITALLTRITEIM
jgi:hypothetical protein